MSSRAGYIVIHFDEHAAFLVIFRFSFEPASGRSMGDMLAVALEEPSGESSGAFHPVSCCFWPRACSSVSPETVTLSCLFLS